MGFTDLALFLAIVGVFQRVVATQRSHRTLEEVVVVRSCSTALVCHCLKRNRARDQMWRDLHATIGSLPKKGYA